MTTPALFISHGSPKLPVKNSPAHRFLSDYAAELPRPSSILIVSAQWKTAEPCVATAPQPGIVYDNSDFDRGLFDIHYPATGNPELSREIADLLAERDLPCHTDPVHGWDSGVWAPLHLLFPGGDIPVSQLSIQPQKDPEHHYRVGQALAGLRERNVMIIASGAMTHNVREYYTIRIGNPTPRWASSFADWMCEKLEQGCRDDLIEYRRLAPNALANHPENDHLLPLYVALGASSENEPIRRVHNSYDRVIAMDVYRFGV